MESQIKIKATVPQMSEFFEKDGGVRYYEIKDKRYSEEDLKAMSEDKYNSEVFTFSVRYRHMELEKPLTGTFTIDGLTKTMEAFKDADRLLHAPVYRHNSEYAREHNEMELYNKWLGGHDKLSNRDLLRLAIDAALEKKPKDFDSLLALLKSSGYTVSRKGRLSLRHENQKKSIRLDSLGEGYSEQELRAVLAGGKTHNPFVKKKYPKRKERTTLISEIEAKLNSGKGYWYDQKMKVVKLKPRAKTFVYLEEQGFADFAALSNAASAAEERFNELKASIKTAETRMSEIQTLRTHIINYSKTREVYAGYRKAGYSKKYLAEHESDIILHKAAKKAFDDFGLKKLPTVKSLNEEFARLLTEKKAAYADYHKTQEQMRELMIHKANAAYLLGLEERKQQIAERQREEK